MLAMPPIEFCLPTSGKAVPSGPDWIHEVKYDGYRLRVVREGDRVRLFSKGGHDWTGRYPWIVETARKIRKTQFILDGEAVVLGVDGISDFNALHSGKHDHEVQLYAFDCLALRATISERCRCTCAKQIWRSSSGTDPRGSSWLPSSKARSAPTCSMRRARLGLRAWCRNIASAPTVAAGATTGSRSRTASTRPTAASRTSSEIGVASGTQFE